MSKIFRLSFWVTLLFFLPFVAVAQNYTVRGKITDERTKDPLIGVPVAVTEKLSTGVFTNQDGEYKITLPKGDYTLVVKYVGYEDKKVKISLTKDIIENVSLKSSSIDLNEVVVSSRRADENVAGVQTGVEKMSIQEINQLPVLFGERDVVKAIQLMPGVKSAGEGGTGFYVRGGSADQNLVLLDNVGIYNASHLMGFFSAFNSDMVRDVTLYKGALPSQYGERLSSILDVQMRDGDNQDYHVNGGLGLISSKLNVEGPIKKGKSSFIVGARRTYADVIARAFGSEDVKNTTLYFYDLNMKLNFNLSDKDRLTFTAYSGMDKLGITDVVDTDWGNTVGTLKWTRLMGHKWTSSTALIYNRYSYNVAVDMNQDLRISSIINDYALKQEFTFTQNSVSSWKFGVHSTYHDMAPGKFDVAEDKGVSKHLKNKYSWENGLYASNTVKVTDRLEIMYGLRLSAFSVLGAGDFYNLNENHEVIDTVSYKSGEFVKTYFNLEPRLSMAYRLNDVSSVKAAYARTTQSMHLLSNPTFASPFDRWVPTSNNIKPQIADQFTLGYFRNFANNLFEFSAEVYYKDMRNQIDFKDNALTFTNDDVETELLFGKGRAYGIELMLKKRVGRFSGWVSYTLSKSEKQIDGINNNKWYDAVQDRTHDISFVAMYSLNEKWNLSAAFVYYTGNAVTYPSGKYQIDGKEVVYYTERNGYRAPDYHRLDLGATCVLKKTKKFYSELAFSLYNAYGRENAYMIEFRTNDDDPSKSTAYQYSLFRFVPSISWNFRF